MDRLELTPEQFFEGLLAALRLRSSTGVIEGEPTSIHRAFYRVLKALQKSDVLDVDLFDLDYDPLYGQSGWFDRALTTAQRDAVIGFANPSYNSIKIKYTSSEGKRILNSFGGKEEFERLAGIFASSLDARAMSSIGR